MRSRMRNRNGAGGFSLMELVLVLGLLGLLAGLTAPALSGVRLWLAERESRLLFMEVETACRLYRMERGGWPDELTGREILLNGDPVDWRRVLGPYMERPVADETLVDGRGNTDIRMVLDTDGDHWIEGSELSGLAEAERPERLWSRVAIYSLDTDGNLSAKNWEAD